MTAQPTGPAHGPDTGSYEVVVPAADFIQLRALERLASEQELEDAEDTAALQERRAREAAARDLPRARRPGMQRLGLTG